MKYVNEHKELIGRVLKESPSLMKWQARVVANRIIGNTILADKGLSTRIQTELRNSEFETLAKIKELKMQIKNVVKTH